MSLTICVTTPEGIILAADSRQSYSNVVRSMRIGSDSATKIFPVDDNIAVTVAGPAFLPDPDNPSQARGIGTFVQEVIDEIAKKDTVSSVADKIKDHLESVYKPKERL
jgi:20S proteasome alpha/beta subunit